MKELTQSQAASFSFAQKLCDFQKNSHNQCVSPISVSLSLPAAPAPSENPWESVLG